MSFVGYHSGDFALGFKIPILSMEINRAMLDFSRLYTTISVVDMSFVNYHSGIYLIRYRFSLILNQ